MSILGELRRARGLSQFELARRLGRSQTLLCRWERGTRSPSIDDALRLEMVMGTEPGLYPRPDHRASSSARIRRRSIAINSGRTVMALRC
jgi:transcriptional regulator with XRE-family HTH domain